MFQPYFRVREVSFVPFLSFARHSVWGMILPRKMLIFADKTAARFELPFVRNLIREISGEIPESHGVSH